MPFKNEISKVVFEFPDIKASAFCLDKTNSTVLLAGRNGVALLDITKKIASQVLIKQFLKNYKWDIVNALWVKEHSNNLTYFILTYNQCVTLCQMMEGLSLKEIGISKRHTRVISDADVSEADNNFWITSSLDKFCYGWDVRCFNKDIKPTFILASLSPITQSKWSKYDMNTIATTHESSIHIWDIRNTKTPCHFIQAHFSTINSLEWKHSNNGVGCLASASQDNTLKLWAENTYHLSQMVSCQYPVWRIRFLPELGNCISTIPIPGLRPGISNVSLWNLNSQNPSITKLKQHSPALAREVKSSITQPMQYFIGPRDFVIDFAWRSISHNAHQPPKDLASDEDVEDSQPTHQLITWGRDHCIRMWDLRPEISKYFSQNNQSHGDPGNYAASMDLIETGQDILNHLQPAVKPVISKTPPTDPKPNSLLKVTKTTPALNQKLQTPQQNQSTLTSTDKVTSLYRGEISSEPDDSDAIPNPMMAMTKRMNRFISSRAPETLQNFSQPRLNSNRNTLGFKGKESESYQRTKSVSKAKKGLSEAHIYDDLFVKTVIEHRLPSNNRPYPVSKTVKSGAVNDSIAQPSSLKVAAPPPLKARLISSINTPANLCLDFGFFSTAPEPVYELSFKIPRNSTGSKRPLFRVAKCCDKLSDDPVNLDWEKDVENRLSDLAFDHLCAKKCFLVPCLRVATAAILYRECNTHLPYTSEAQIKTGIKYGKRCEMGMKPARSAIFNEINRNFPDRAVGFGKRASLSNNEVIKEQDNENLSTSLGRRGSNMLSSFYDVYNNDSNIPFPRTSGARFSGSNYLVCFTRPDGLNPEGQKKAKLTLTTPRALSALSAHIGSTTQANADFQLAARSVKTWPKPSPKLYSISDFYRRNDDTNTATVTTESPKIGMFPKRSLVAPITITDVSNYLALDRELALNFTSALEESLQTGTPTLLQFCESMALTSRGTAENSSFLKVMWLSLGITALPTFTPLPQIDGRATANYIEKQFIEPLLRVKDLQSLAMIATVMKAISKAYYYSCDKGDGVGLDHRLRYVDNDYQYYVIPATSLCDNNYHDPERLHALQHSDVMFRDQDKSRHYKKMGSPSLLGHKGNTNANQGSNVSGSNTITPTNTGSFGSKLSSAFPSVVFGKKKSLALTPTLGPFCKSPSSQANGNNLAPSLLLKTSVKIDGNEIYINEMKKSNSWCQLNYVAGSMVKNEISQQATKNQTSLTNTDPTNMFQKALRFRFKNSLSSAINIESIAQHHTENDTKKEIETYFISKSALLRYDHYITMYANILYAWEMFHQRAYLVKQTSFSPERHKGLPLMTWCNRCSKLVQGAQCQSCTKYLLRCVLCRLPIKGLYNCCCKCGHAIHTSHGLQWYKHKKHCPSGCGCICLI